MSLNKESLLTLHVESQHAVKHCTSERHTFTLQEYGIIFGLLVEKQSNGFLSRQQLTSFKSHQNSRLSPPHAGRNRGMSKLKWGRGPVKMHCESVRQRNVRPDNTMHRAGTLALNLCETEAVLKQQVEFTERHGKSSERKCWATKFRWWGQWQL